jgi:peptide/nickel transport system substrate-binding protein/oligopeptide transport system substrate-binding protein
MKSLMIGTSVLFFFLAAACAGMPDEEQADRGEARQMAPDRPVYAEERPGVRDRRELTIACSLDNIELDFRKSILAPEAQVYTGLYEGLFSYHPLTMEPVPAVAGNWKISEDRKTWTFTLREDARYWNGDPVRAADFRAAWLSVIDPSKSSPYSSLFDIIAGAKDFRLGGQPDAARVGIETPDDRTLVVRLVSPASFFPAMLCHHSFGPVHPSMLAAGDWSRDPPVSNGPYRVLERNTNSMTLVANEKYWDAAEVAIQKLILVSPKNGVEATAMWNSGRARWVADDLDLDTLTDRSGTIVNPLFATHYYFIRSVKKPFANNDVRRALALALPWEEIREDYLLPATTFVYPIPGYPEVRGMSAMDMAEAKRLLAAAGYPGGQGLPEIVVRLSPGMEYALVPALMADAWKELGLKVRLDIVESGRYFETLRRDDYDVGASTWIGDFADPYTFLQMFQKDSNLNDARYNDPEYERLIEKSMREEGPERWATLAEAEKRLLDQGTVLPIYYKPAINIIDTNEIDGWFPNVLNLHPYKYLSYKALRPLPGITLAR